jgi:putative PIN family toxin of toxin-antitoxin system
MQIKSGKKKDTTKIPLANGWDGINNHACCFRYKYHFSFYFALSPYSIIIDRLINKQYELVVTNEILLEYEERLTENFDAVTATGFINALYNLSNVLKVNRLFASELIIADLDDNKFVDAYYSGSVHHLVTNDKHLIY